MARRSRAPVLRGAASLLLSRPDDCRLAAKGRAGRVPAAGRFWRGAAGHAGFSGGGRAAHFIFLRQHQGGWREALGFHGPRLPRTLLMALLLAIAILPVAWGLQFISVDALTWAGWRPKEQIAVTLLANTKSWWMRVYLGAFAVVLAPVAEEFIFRGMLYPFVKQLGWPRLAWVGVSF